MKVLLRLLDCVTGALTLPFRCADILFSRRHVDRGIFFYSGVDPKGCQPSVFFERCALALGELDRLDGRRHDLFVRYIGRIIGTEAPTKFWFYPRILELNYDLVLRSAPLEIAAVIVGETAVARLWRCRRVRSENPQRFYDACLKDEIRFREAVRGERFTNLEKRTLLESKSWIWVNQRRQIIQALRGIRGLPRGDDPREPPK
jgi:hypothetical protein